MTNNCPMQDLIDKLPEIYEDVEYQGKTWKGLRDCEERWNLIKDHIKPHDVVLDLGSSLGYYSKKIAKEYPDSLVISFESDPVMCEIQKRLFEDEGIYNVVVCNYRLGVEDLVKWSQHVEIFDTVLALAVLHHFPSEDVPIVWEKLEYLSSKIIFELADENIACGGYAKEKARQISLTRPNVKRLGVSKSHLQNSEREMWVAKLDRYRPVLDAFFGVSHPDRHRFEIKDGQINGKNIIKGVNVWNLLHFNIVWPKSNWWKVQARKAYESLEWKSDVKPWNLLVSSTGLVAIDFTDKFPPEDKASFHEKDLDEMDRMFTKMKPRYEM